VTNLSPVALARRIQRRRKTLGADNPLCFYCGESRIACLDKDHPFGRAHDTAFTRIVCSNCHREMEMERDIAGVTKNGRRLTMETEDESLLNFLLRSAHDHQAIAESIRRKVTSYADPNKKTRRTK
jgi:hypothetical protein